MIVKAHILSTAGDARGTLKIHKMYIHTPNAL
jgi:hypothetical protein